MRAWLIWLLGALFFFSMYIPRVATGVITADLMHDFAVSAGAIGTLTSFYFYPYLIMQVPVGITIDRFGPRILLTIMVSLCGISCLIFARAESIGLAEVSRALLGFTGTFAFVGALKLAAEWFSPSKIGLLSGLTQSLGMLGAMVGEHPIALSASSFGWRSTYIGLAVMFFVLAALILIIVRDKPGKSDHFHVEHHAHEGSTLWQEAKFVIGNPQSWINGLYAGFLFAPTAAFAEQWGNYHLQVTYGMKDGALGISLIFAGWAIAGPMLGWLSSKMGKRKPLMQISAILSCVFFCLILYVPMSKATLFSLMFLFGICNTGVVLAYALATEINPHRVAGTSLAIANMMSILIGAIFQPVIGYLIDFFASSHQVVSDSLQLTHNGTDLKQAMSILPACLLVAFILVFFIRETNCKPFEQQQA